MDWTQTVRRYEDTRHNFELLLHRKYWASRDVKIVGSLDKVIHSFVWALFLRPAIFSIQLINLINWKKARQNAGKRTDPNLGHCTCRTMSLLLYVMEPPCSWLQFDNNKLSSSRCCWQRLTRASASERDQVLSAYIRHDVLGCNQPGVHRVRMIQYMHTDSQGNDGICSIKYQSRYCHCLKIITAVWWFWDFW